MALAGARAHQVEAIVSELRDRELRADAALLGQRVAERDAADLRRHLVRHQLVEPRLAARSRDLVLGERREVDHADLLAHPPALVADVLEVVRAPEAPPVLARDAFRREPVGALPAVALSPHGAHPVQLLVDGAGLRGARVVALLVRIVDGEHVAVGLLVLAHRVALAAVGAEAARIHAQHVDARVALGDPFRELPARAAGGRHAEAVALVQPDVVHVPCRADQRAAVRRIRDGPVDDGLDPAVLEARDALHRRLDVRQQPVEIAGEELLAELGGHAVGEARRRALFVRPEDPPHPLLAQVVRRVGFPQHRELAAAARAVRLELGGFVVHDVLVLDGNRRHVEPEHAAGLARVVAGGADDVLATDVAVGSCERSIRRRACAPHRAPRSARGSRRRRCARPCAMPSSDRPARCGRRRGGRGRR